MATDPATRWSVNGWRTCSRGHKFRCTSACPTCWPGRKATTKRKKP